MADQNSGRESAREATGLRDALPDRAMTREAVEAFLEAYRLADSGDVNAHRKAVSRLLKLGQPGAALHTAYMDTDGGDRTKVYDALRGVASRAIDIRLPIFKTAHQFANDLDRLNPVPERTPEPPTPHALAEAEERLSAISERIDAFRQEATRELQGALNAYLAEMAKAQRMDVGDRRQKAEDALSYKDKESIRDIVNSSLERLGLAVGYQGHTCNFDVTTGAKHGRFLLVPKGSKTPVLTRVNLSDFLPLELTDAQPRREGLKEWREREQARRVAAQEAAHRE